MQRCRLWLGMMTAILLLAGQAWAATVAPPTGIGLPSGIASSSSFTISIGASSTAGVSYVIQEATDAGFTTGVITYPASTSRYQAISAVGKASGTYYYRAKATLGADESAWTASRSIALPLQAAPPTGIGLTVGGATSSSLTISIGASSTIGASYVVQEATDAGFTTGVVTYPASTSRYQAISTVGKTSGTYYYHAKAVVAGCADSAWTDSKSLGLPLQAAAPSGIGLVSSSSNGKFTISIGASSLTGASYVVQEATDAGFTTGVVTYPASTSLAQVITGKNGMFYYRAKATKTGFADSAWTSSKSIATANSAACVDCHTTSGLQAAWAASQHGNPDGSPAGYVGNCATCHSPTAELNASNNMAVTCTACHKPGVPASGNHTAQAVGNVITLCRSCHDSDHFGYGKEIGAKVAASKHADGRGHNTTAKCERCHTTEGSIQFAAYTGDKAAMTVMDTANGGGAFPQIVTDQGPTCAACHDHQGKMRAVTGWDPNQNSVADQFDTCTSCHTLFRNDGSVVASDATTGFYHNTSWHRTIASTHYDNPATTSVIEGYNLRKTGSSPCFDCHGHELFTNTRYAGATRKSATGDAPGTGTLLTATESKTTIHTDWAQSAHAGGLLKNKYAVARLSDGQTKTDTVALVDSVMATGVTDAPIGNAWAHYDWDKSNDTVAGDRTGRKDCQRCHTATGISNFLNSPATYNAANNNFSHLSSWTATTGSAQQEVLYCWGCHKSVETGELRNPGAITEVYAGTPTVTVKYPDLGPSNVCMGCHLGREVGQNVAVSTGNFTNLSFINSHYLTAGSTILNESGYEYAGQSYDSLGYHKNVGMNNAYGTGTGGPCVGCHMSSNNAHSFSVVTEDAGGVITAITSNACASCHGGLTAAILEKDKEEFHVALAALRTALEAKGIFFYEAHPYFYKDVNGDGIVPTPGYTYDHDNNATTAAVGEINSNNAFKNWDGVYPGKGKDVMGAAFNYNLLEHDPGAYAHNRQYALKLIADSIDFLADGTVDGLGIPTAVTNVVYSLEFAEATSHPAGIVTAASSTNCGICHTNAPHYGGAALAQAQYVSGASLPVTCANCHKDGNTTTNGAILVQFAESAHGDPNGEAWWHYDWRSDGRKSCARCHNGTAYVAKLGNETNTTLIFNGTTDNNLPSEVLNCSACHSDTDTGAIRTAALGLYTETYADGSTFAFPQRGKSNLCFRCHTGRESGGTIKAKPDSPSTLSFVNSHYLAAGGTVFTTTGYTYTGLSYSNPPAYLHNKAGLTDVDNPQESDRGPCVLCHMGNATANHTWEAVAKDTAGSITAILSNGCNDCHSGGFAITSAQLNTAKAQFQASLVALDGALQNKGIYFYNASPYFFTAPYVVGGTNTSYTAWGTAYGDAQWKNTMGAAFNLNLMEHDPGAYVHNSRYTRRLIRDAIDFIDDGNVTNNTVSGTLTSLQMAGKITAQQASDALDFLGTTRP